MVVLKHLLSLGTCWNLLTLNGVPLKRVSLLFIVLLCVVPDCSFPSFSPLRLFPNSSLSAWIYSPSPPSKEKAFQKQPPSMTQWPAVRQAHTLTSKLGEATQQEEKFLKGRQWSERAPAPAVRNPTRTADHTHTINAKDLYSIHTGSLISASPLESWSVDSVGHSHGILDSSDGANTSAPSSAGFPEFCLKQVDTKL